MFCSKCGAQIPDGSSFCPNCGNVMEPAAPQAPQGTGAPVNTGYYNPAGGYAAAPAGAYAAPKPAKKKSSGKVIGLIAGIVAVAAVAVVAVVLLTGKPYQKPIENMFKALNNCDYDLLAKSTSGDVYDDLSYTIEYALDEGVSPEYTYNILNARKLEGNELSTAQSEYSGTAFYAVDLSISYYDPDWEDTDTESGTILVGKIGGKWVVCEVDYYY